MTLERWKPILLFCFSLLFPGMFSNAQTTKVDELLNQLEKNTSDTAQIRIMRKLSTAYSAVDPVKKFYYADQYRLLAEKNGNDSLVASAYLDMGISYGIRSNLDSALYYFNLGFDKAKESNYVVGIARSYANIGYAYDRLERKKDAVESYEAALKIYRRLNVQKAINQMITNLGSIYYDLGEYKIADGYFRQVLELVLETPDDEIGLGNALFTLGNSNLKLGDASASLDYFKKSLAVREKIGDLNGIALSNWGLGLLYIDKKQYKKAFPHLEIALKNNIALKNLYQQCVVHRAFAEAYLGLKEYESAEKHAKLALLRARESKSQGLVSLALELLVKVSKEQKKFADALHFQSDLIAVSDSLNNSKVRKDVILSDLHRINSDNRSLQRDNRSIVSKNSTYIIAISVITALLAIVVVLMVLYYKRNLEKKTANVLLHQQKQEISDINEELEALNEELITQSDVVAAQNIELEKLNQVKSKFFSIVSHDLRGPLMTIKTLIGLYRNGDLTEDEWTELLGRLEETTDTTAAFLDNLLEWSRNQMEGIAVNPSDVSLCQIAEENIKLLSYQINLKEIKVENRIAKDVKAYADPNMVNIVVRNLLSNAVKFCKADDEIILSATVGTDNTVCSISDSGPGISEKERENLFDLTHTTSTGTNGEKGYHVGLVLCKDMILQNNGSIAVHSIFGEGTRFDITLPAPEGD